MLVIHIIADIEEAYATKRTRYWAEESDLILFSSKPLSLKLGLKTGP